MAIEQHGLNQEEGKITISFSNGAFKQLMNLKEKYHLEKEIDVIELAINVLDLAEGKDLFVEDENGEKYMVKVNR